MKTIKVIIILTLVSIFTTTTYAAEVPRESAPCNATNEAIIFVESCIGDILTEVQSGLGYSDARAKSNRIFFNRNIPNVTFIFHINIDNSKTFLTFIFAKKQGA